MKKDNLTVLSLFDGMSCGRITLDKMGITPKAYYASELDKFAIKETQANWPDTVQLGDVTKWREWDVDWASIDLLIGGSPCQGFSFAGKQLAFDDPRSALFFVYVDILNHVKSLNPDVKFMLENVRMKKEHLNVITEYLGVEPVFINSALVSAQNRQRYHWSNWEVIQPEDRGILLNDIIEKEPTNPTYMSDKFVNRQRGRKCLVDDLDRKASNLSSMEYVKNGRQGDYVICMKPRGNNKGGLRALDGKTPSMTSCSWQENFKLTNGVNYRKLTVVECCRLQGVPDDYFKVSSNTQAYKMLGNGWQCDTIEHIFNCLFNPQ